MHKCAISYIQSKGDNLAHSRKSIYSLNDVIFFMLIILIIKKTIALICYLTVIICLPTCTYIYLFSDSFLAIGNLTAWQTYFFNLALLSVKMY